MLPFPIYTDLESFNQKIIECENNSENYPQYCM